MIKKNELSEDNSSKKNQINQERNENQIKNINKTSKNIINKIHSIKASINNNTNKLHFVRRKNNFRRTKDASTKKNTSRSRSKNREVSNSLNKSIHKNKLLNEKKKINNEESLNNNMNNLYNNCSFNDPNSRKNSFYDNIHPNNNMNNNNIIITINNYNKISPTNIVNTANINDKKTEIKCINDKKSKKYNKNELKNDKKINEKKEYNNYKTSHDYNLDNNQKNIYNNNIFYNQVIYNKNDNNLINAIEDNNIDNLSINTYNTINKSNNLINSNTNTTNREFSNKTLAKKMNKYQDNIILKKKQLEMYSPLSFLKKNLEIDKKTLDNLIFKEKNNNDNLSSFNNTNINSKFTSTTELGINDKKEENNKIDDKSNNNNDENLTKIIIDKIEQNIKNKKQVGNILSTLNRIKNTKQLYKNKKLYGYTKINKKKAKPSINSNRNNFSYYKVRPYNFYNNREKSFNDRLYYSRSNSKNALSNNFNMKYRSLNKNRTSKSNQKLINKSFTSENRDNLYTKKKSNNNLLLTQRKNNDRLYSLNSHKIRNIRTEKRHIKTKTENTNSISINTSINDIANSPILTEFHKPILNNLKKINNLNNSVSISNNIDSSFNNNKIIDTYESATIANIDKHCDSLLSRINKKIKEKDSYNTINVISNNLKLNESEIKDNKICKKLIANASLCRKGLNRPEEEAKINQDTLFKVKFGDLNYSYYGVCDGHGPLGHLVSDFIKSNLTFIVYKHIKSLLIQKSNSIDFNSNNTINLNSVDDSFIDFPKLFKESFLLMESKLSENKNIDIELSGTTCISLLFCEDRIISSNIGDSRAIKGFYNELDNKWEYIALSRDHKPSDLDEAERIKSCKGKIHPYIDDDGKYVGPDRVWNEEEELPGLAMSRSFGDEIAKKIGVYSEPEVKIFPYNEEDKFIVIASDGLWEYVSNKEVTDIVGKYHEKNDCDGAVSKLYEISKERWIKYDDYIDDISIIVAFLDNVK